MFLEQRIIPEPNSGCWFWVGGLSSPGYGKFNKDGERVAVHRYVYEFFKGKIPDALEIDHLCRVRCCCNPSHLEAVTAKENGLRGMSVPAINARKTHCLRGHELAGNNIWFYAGKRKCKQCNIMTPKQRREFYCE